MLSAVVLAQNEEKNIERCLQSLKFCDEILVIDDNSTDKTIDIAKKHGATVYIRALKDDFSSQRTFAQQKAKHEWILYIDADEVVSEKLQSEINAIFQDKREEIKENNYKNPTNYQLPATDCSAFYIRRRDHFWGKPVIHGELSTAYNTGFIRLVKKGAGEWRGEVHETYMTAMPTRRLDGFIEHYPHQSITSFLEEVNHYSTLRAKELYHAGHQPSVVELLLYPGGKFLYTYFLKQGFRDGAAGFVYSFLMSFHSFLVRAKLYQYKNIDA